MILYHPAAELHSQSFNQTAVELFRVEVRPTRLRYQTHPDLFIAGRDFRGGVPVGLVSKLYQEFQEPDAVSHLAIEGLGLELIAALARQPDNAEAHYVLGLCLEKRAAFPEAVAEMRRASGLAADHLGALSHLVTLEMRLGHPEDAERFREAHAAALFRKRVEERVRVHRVNGVEAFNREDYPAALREFQAVADEDPKDPQARLYLGSVRIALGDLDRAKEELETSLRLDPHSERAFMELGRLHALAGRLDESIAAFHKAIAANPQFAEPHYFLAGVHRARGEVDLYQEEIKRYQELRSRSRGGAMEVVDGPSKGGP